MRMSTKAQYAVRAMVNLNLYSEGSPVSLRDISLRESISLTYLEQLFVKLRRGQIVKSVRGPGGGYLAGPACARDSGRRDHRQCRGIAWSRSHAWIRNTDVSAMITVSHIMSGMASGRKSATSLPLSLLKN